MISKDIELLQYNCIITPLTPIQIGNGNEVSPFEYIIKNNEYYRVDMNEIMEKMPEGVKKQFLKILEENNMFAARKFLKNNYKIEYGYLYKCHVSTEYSEMYERKIGGVLNKNENNELSVGEFIGTDTGKYIPGSTLKGAFRTAYLAGNFDSKYFYNIKRNSKTKTKPFIYAGDFKEGDKKRKYIEAGILEMEILEPKFDPFKNFKVTDTEIRDDIIEVKEILRKGTKNGKKTEMPMGSFEVTKSIFGSNENMEMKFQISVKNIAREAERLYIKSSIRKDKNGNILKPIVKNAVSFYVDDEIISSLNEKAEKILEKDIAFFEKIHDIKSLKFCQKLKKYKESLNENQALIRIGRGAGFNSTTFNLYNKNIEEIFTKVTIEDMPIGWAVITFEEI